MSTTLLKNCFRLKYNITDFKFTNFGACRKEKMKSFQCEFSFFFDIEVYNNVYSIKKVIKSHVRKTINYCKGFRNRHCVRNSHLQRRDSMSKSQLLVLIIIRVKIFCVLSFSIYGRLFGLTNFSSRFQTIRS